MNPRKYFFFVFLKKLEEWIRSKKQALVNDESKLHSHNNNVEKDYGYECTITFLIVTITLHTAAYCM